jgi:hypothetical protein
MQRIRSNLEGLLRKRLLKLLKRPSWNLLDKIALNVKKDFPYDKEWNKVYYKTKQVRPIFIEEEEEIITVEMIEGARKTLLRIMEKLELSTSVS